MLFLRKDREPISKEFDDDEWISTLPSEAKEGGEDDWRQSVPESEVVEGLR